MSENVRNPPWSREETILALDLYLELDGEVPSQSDPLVIELSDYLRNNPEMHAYQSRENFRSPSAVVLKLNNIKQAADGGGLPHNSQMDREIWEQLGERREETKKAAETIKSAILSFEKEPETKTEDEAVFLEGNLVTKIHKTRERNPKLRKRVLAKRREAGELSCDICSSQYARLGKRLEEAAFEVHHVVPLSDQGRRLNRVSDTALLCATCHRLIHALISERKQWQSIEDARRALRQLETI